MKMDIKYIVIVLVLLVILSNNKMSKKNQIIAVDTDNVKLNIENSEYDHILDIRTNMEKSVGHLTIATHVTLEDLSSVENIIQNKNNKILVISKNAQRASLFAEYISSKGFKMYLI